MSTDPGELENAWWLSIPITDHWLRLYAEGYECPGDTDENGNRPCRGLADVLDFAAGHDPTDFTVLDPGDPDLPGFAGARVVESHSPTIHPNNLGYAMLKEIERLRDLCDVHGLPPADVGRGIPEPWQASS